MAQANRIEQADFTFVKGLITEAGPFVFPPDACTDCDNIVFNLNGSVQRRLGLDYESGYTLFSKSVASTDAVGVHDWFDVNGDANTAFQVVQIGSTLYFYTFATPLSAGKKSFSVNLLSHKVTGTSDATVAASRIDTAYGRGVLFVMGTYIEPFYVTYTSGTDSIAETEFVIYERDFIGVDDTLDVSTHPSSLSDEHGYNLLNQGWTTDRINSYWSQRSSLYPSNADIAHDGYYTDPSTGKKAWHSDDILNTDSGNTIAPRGHFIHNVFDTTQSFSMDNNIDNTLLAYAAGVLTVTTTTAHGLTTSDSVTLANTAFTKDTGAGCAPGDSDTWDGTYTCTVTGTTTFTVPVAAITLCSISAYGYTKVGSVTNPTPITESVRPRTVAFFAGRVFYSGIPSARLLGRVYFSKIIESTDDFGICYQEADPTSEDINELLESDGGSISIHSLGAVLAMEQVGDKLVLFADNGLWELGGGDSTSFKATSYSVRQITTVGCASPASVVMVEDVPYFAAYQGLYTLTQDKISGFLTTTSLTDTTIKATYAAIPDANKTYIAAAYDDILKRIYFVYGTDASYTYKYNKVMVVDLRLSAFAPYTIPITPAYVMGVVAGDSANDAVNNMRFLTFVTGDNVTFATINNTDWLDWYTYDTAGVDAPAYLITGLKTAGDVIRRKQALYLFVYSKRTETQWISGGTGSAIPSPASSCRVQARWDFADSSANGKYTTAFQAYRHLRIAAAPTSLPATFDPGYNIVVTKNKVRGAGKVLQLKFYSESGYDMHLYGWAFPIMGSSEV
jgi:hypothetical protein